MTEIKIENPLDGNFTQVPNAVFEFGLSPLAGWIFVFLLSQRNGAFVRVATIEHRLRVGRDRRRTAMRQLEEKGLIRRQKTRVKGVIVSDVLVVTSVPILKKMVEDVERQEQGEQGGNNRPPEKPSCGEKINRPPEKPADGFSGPLGVENPQNRGGESGPFNNTNTNIEKQVRANPRQSKTRPARLRFPVQVVKQVNPFLAGQLQQGKAIVLEIGGRMQRIEPNTEQAGVLLAQVGKGQ